MEKKLKSILTAAFAVVMLLSLAACGGAKPNGSTAPSAVTPSATQSSPSGNSTETKKPTEQVYLSDMLEDGGTRIWYEIGSNSIGKDARIRSAFVFENGEVTCYFNSAFFKDFSLGDVAKLTDEEILENLIQSDTEYRAEIFTDFGLAVTGEGTTAPPYAYTLNVITDSTGNNTSSEKIIYTRESNAPVPAGDDKAVTVKDLFRVGETELHLVGGYIEGQVYDSLYGGLVLDGDTGRFITRITETLIDTAPIATISGTKLDTPQHPGVTVD